MTVRELIEELQKMPLDLEVETLYVGDYNSYSEIFEVRIEDHLKMTRSGNIQTQRVVIA